MYLYKIVYYDIQAKCDIWYGINMIENVQITRLKRATENDILFRVLKLLDINFLDIVALLSGSSQLIPRSILWYNMLFLENYVYEMKK